MRIVHLLAPAPAGGLERVVQSLSIGFARRAHDVHVVAVCDQWHFEESFAAPLRANGVRIHPVTVPPRAYRSERRAVRATLASISPDVVHSHGYRTDVLDLAVARELRLPTVSTAHGFTGGSLRNRLYERLQRHALRRCDAVIAVSERLERDLRDHGVAEDRIHLLPNSLIATSPLLTREEARRNLGIGPGSPVVGWVGRMSAEKGLDVFLESLLMMRGVKPTVCLIGDGPERQRLAARAARDHVHDVRWAGRLADAGKYMAAFDIFVLSSRTEGTPIALLEALVADCRIVATAVGEVPRVLAGNTRAILVPPESPGALAEAVESQVAATVDSAQMSLAPSNVSQIVSRANEWLSAHERIYAAICSRS